MIIGILVGGPRRGGFRMYQGEDSHSQSSAGPTW
jgi:hypothetical protein